MNQEEQDKLQYELTEVVKKWNLRGCSFCGSCEEATFIGFRLGGNNKSEFWEAVMNIGRLWQFAREQSRSVLNQFERPRKS